jgi:hypothetical protein
MADIEAQSAIQSTATCGPSDATLVLRSQPFSYQSSATLSVPEGPFVDPDSLPSVVFSASALEALYKDGEHVITWDGLSATGMDTEALYRAQDDVVDGPSLSFDSMTLERENFTSHPTYIDWTERPSFIHLLGYSDRRGRLFSIVHGEGFLLEMSFERSNLNSQRDDLVITTNVDFFETRTFRYESFIEHGSLFLLTIGLTDHGIDVYRHTSVDGVYDAQSSPPSSFLEMPDESDGIGDVLLNQEGFLRIDGGTFSEIVIQGDTQMNDLRFIWRWMYDHYGA